MNGEATVFAWMLNLALMLALAKIFEAVIVRLGLPRVVGYVSAGLVLAIIGFEIDVVSYAFALVGIIVMLFYAGLGETTKEFMRGLKKAGLVASGGVVGALASGLIAGLILGLPYSETLALSVAYSATSVSITVKTLEELGRIGSVESRVIVGAAVVDDVLGLSLISVMVGIAKGSLDPYSILGTTVLAFAFWAAIVVSSERMPKPLMKLSRWMKVEAFHLTVTFIILILLSYLAIYVKLSAILLAYALGLGLSSHYYLRRRIAAGIYPLVAIFTPLFFVYAGTLVDLEEVAGAFLTGAFIITASVILVFGFLSKILGCALTARLLGFDKKTSLIVGVGMVPRGEVMLVTAAMALELGIMSYHVYSALLTLIITSSIVVPIILKKIYAKI